MTYIEMKMDNVTFKDFGKDEFDQEIFRLFNCSDGSCDMAEILGKDLTYMPGILQHNKDGIPIFEDNIKHMMIGSFYDDKQIKYDGRAIDPQEATITTTSGFTVHCSDKLSWELSASNNNDDKTYSYVDITCAT